MQIVGERKVNDLCGCSEKPNDETKAFEECRPLLQSEEVGGLPGICFCRSNLVK